MRGEPGQVRSIVTRLQALADECVMCGLCLPHCPTFRLRGREQYSPRGRIALARLLDNASIDHSIRESLESCLQCRACERVCPAQVRYGEIIEGARAVLRRSGAATRTLAERAALRPQVAAGALALAGRIARVWPQATRHLGRRARWLLRAGSVVDSRPRGPAPTVLFSGCVARSFDSEAQRALLQVARMSGLDLRPLPEQACCGAIARHVGASTDAYTLIQSNRTQWAAAGTREVVALDSGCIDALRHTAGSGIDVVEACRWLLDRQPEWSCRLRAIPARIGLFAPCSHRHIVGDAAAARRLLLALPGVEVVSISEGLGCCGAAGPHLLAHPKQADALAQPIVESILVQKLDAIATTNIGCALHLGERLALRGITLPLRHPVAFLADRLPPARA